MEVESLVLESKTWSRRGGEDIGGDPADPVNSATQPKLCGIQGSADSMCCRYADPDLGPKLELASRHLNETEHAGSKQKPLKRARFRDRGGDGD